MKKRYLIFTCEADNARDLDDNINLILKQEDIIPISISTTTYTIDDEIRLLGTVLYMCEDKA